MRKASTFVSFGGFLLALALAVPQAAARDLPDFVSLAEKSSPAVVNISTRQSERAGPHGSRQFEIPELPEDSPLNDLFKRFFGDQLEDFTEERRTQSLGSGFIISDDGYILTNYHVVESADEIVVRLTDRKVYDATVVGSDKGSDVALLKIDAEELPVVDIGRSSDLKVGEWVLAIGSPFGFDHTVTAGIVSAKGRSLPSENYVPFIQTDVAINPGNSGGPLFNLDGEVVGINSQIYSRTGGFMGLSFAIPIELAMNVAEQLRTKGRVSRGYLGVLIQDVDRNLAESFGLDHPRGALVARVLPDSPAAAAGIRTGDIILEFNGTRLLNSSQLPPLVGTSVVDEDAELKILREGKERTVAVRLGELPQGEGMAAVPRSEPETKTGRLGMSVKGLSDEERAELGLEGGRGVLVESVADGAARAAGIRSGDVILMFNGQPVGKVDELESAVEALEPGRSVAVLVQRGESPIFLALRVPRAE
jgi:serine protease Do